MQYDPLAATLLARLASRLAGLEQAGVGEPGEVLAGAAHRDVEHLGHVRHGRLATAANGIEHAALGR